MDEEALQFLGAIKPVLSLPDADLAGYRTLQEMEAKYTEIALREMALASAIVYREISLFDSMLRGDHDCTSDSESGMIACQLRLRLGSTAVASMKVSFDLALAGYYSQAFGVMRHLYESWQSIAYIRMRLQDAPLWHPFPDGRPANPPGTKTIARGVRRADQGQFPQITVNAREVERQIVACHAGAHPSLMAMVQPESGQEGRMQLGANINRGYLRNWFVTGTIAPLLLMDELRWSVEVDATFEEAFDRIGDERNTWFAGEFSVPLSST